MYSNYPMNYNNMPTSYGNLSRYSSGMNTYGTYPSEDERFFWAPFVFGGLAGTALGFGIANNNQLNSGGGNYYQPYPIYPAYPVFPAYSTSNNYYY